MILLLGARGYVGSAFSHELHRRRITFRPLTRSELDYTRFGLLLDCLKDLRPEFLINAAGYTGKPNVDACEEHKADTLLGNAMLPLTIANACAAANVPWGHVSSGCIFNGSPVQEKGVRRIEKDLTKPELRELVETNPLDILGFNELDQPNFCFRSPPCSFYSGTKALGEEAIKGIGEIYVWRLRIPFDECDGARNYLSKLQRYPKVYENVNSISHRGDYVRACLDMWERRVPFGVYNVTNPGFITSRQVVKLIQQQLCPPRHFEFWESDEQFYRRAVRTLRSNCVLDVSKLLATGVKLRPVEDAIVNALTNWKPES